MGIVHHANYLRYFERGRSDFLRRIRIVGGIRGKRIGSTEANLIVSDRAWPSDFLRYEDVLRVLRTRCRFPIWFDLNDSPLAFTIEELRAVNPGLSLEEAADIVGVNPRDIGKLRF